MTDIKLFVCCHQPTEVPKHPLLVPIQVGAALADSHFPGFVHDDTGDNISEKNRSYCELTAQYWAWKNVEADYYGFFHYRRYLYPDIDAKLPYRVDRKPTLELLDKLGYERFSDLIQQHDMILPKGENIHLSVRDHYANAPFHHQRDLELVEQIIREKDPEMAEMIENYLSDTICYFGNIYIMSKKVFDRYCAWLFSILESFDNHVHFKNRSFQEQRVNGYLAERLFGIFYKKSRVEHLQVLELPRVDFIPENGKRLKRKIMVLTLPPGTKRRAVVKHLCKG